MSTGDSICVYAISKRGIVSLTYVSVLRYLKNRHNFESLNQVKSIVETFQYVNLGVTKVTGHDGEVIPAEDYWMISPQYYKEVAKSFSELGELS
jgi:hypothetical protein